MVLTPNVGCVGGSQDNVIVMTIAPLTWPREDCHRGPVPD